MILTPPPTTHYAHARRILICLRYGIGDVLLEWPMLEALRRAAPGTRITALGARPAIQLLDRCPLVDEVVSTQSLGIEHWGSPRSETIYQKVARLLHEHGPFDLVLDALQAPTAVRELLWTAGVGTVEIDQDVQHKVLREGRGVLEAGVAGARAGWNIPIDSSGGTQLDVPRQHQVAAQGWLLRRQMTSARLAAVSPVASLSLKRWPMERLASVADRLAQDHNAVLVFAGPQQELGEELVDAMSHSGRAVAVEAMHLLDTAALLQRCELMVCNDTGLMHLAAAVGTSVVGVFGPTSPRLYRPRGAGATAVCDEPIHCPHRHVNNAYPPGCWFEDTCMMGERSCIDRVSIDDVNAALNEVVAVTARGRRIPAAAS